MGLTGAMALGVANAQQSFYLSENDFTSWCAHFKQILDAKPKEARLQIYSDNKNRIFIKDLLAETYGVALKAVDLKLEQTPPIPLKMSYLVDGVGKVWSLKTIYSDTSIFTWRLMARFSPIPMPFGSRLRLRCGTNHCMISSYSNRRLGALKWLRSDTSTTFVCANALPKPDSSLNVALKQIGLAEFEPLGILDVDENRVLLSQRFLAITPNATEVHHRTILVKDRLIVSEVKDSSAEYFEDGYLINSKVSSDSLLQSIAVLGGRKFYTIYATASKLKMNSGGRWALYSIEERRLKCPIIPITSYSNLITDGQSDYLVLQIASKMYLSKVNAKGVGTKPNFIIQLPPKTKVIAADITKNGEVILLDGNNRASVISLR